MSSGGPPSREVGSGGREAYSVTLQLCKLLLLTVSFNSTRVLLLSNMGGEIASAKL